MKKLYLVPSQPVFMGNKQFGATIWWLWDFKIDFRLNHKFDIKSNHKDSLLTTISVYFIHFVQ